MSGKPPRGQLGDIERDLLAEKPLEQVLRKLVLLGGAVGSSELRSWASAELRGYVGESELPNYRRVNAPLQIDGMVPGAVVRHQTISTMDLPDFVEDEISEVVPLRMGVRELRSMVDEHRDDHIVKLQPPGAALIVRFMNGQDNVNGSVSALYWSVSTIAIEGVLDQVRTRLAELIAELRSTTPGGQTLPSAAQADNAVNLVVHGSGNHISIAQGQGARSSADSLDEGSTPFWNKTRMIGGAIVGVATVVATVIAAIQLHD